MLNWYSRLCNMHRKKELAWNKEIFIPLQPGENYKITVQFPYFGKGCCSGIFFVKLQPNEIHTYRYRTPFLVIQSGKIKRIK